MSGLAFDDLARAAARPVSRRRALRVVGVTALTAAFPLLRPGRARAASCTGADSQPCGSICCPPDALCCPDIPACCPPASGTTSDGRPYTTTCGPAGVEQNNCASHIGCPSGTTGCGDGSGGAYIYAACCEHGEACQGGKCVEACKDGRPRCGKECCARGEHCEKGRCVKTCPPGRARCGDKCCAKGQHCVNGHCRKCPPHRTACGKKCCPKGQDCCDEDSSLCCDTSKGSCCQLGVPGRQRMGCCPPKTTCAPMIKPGHGGVTDDSPQVCCPPDRVVPLRRKICCPPGYVSMNGKIVVPPGDGNSGGLCCEASKACGSGDSITCCGSNQTCQNGVCVGGA